MLISTRIHLCIVASTLLACTFQSKLYDSASDPASSDTEGESSQSPGGSDGESTYQGTTDEPAATEPEPATATSWVETTDAGWTSTTDPTWTSTTGIATDSHGETTAAVTTEWETGTTGVSSSYTTSAPEEPVPCEGEAEPIDAEVLAYLESQIAADPDSAGTTGEDDDPNLLYVRFSSETHSCADPHDRLACGNNWELSVRIPSAFQAPGLYALSWPGVYAFGLETDTDQGGDNCSSGGSEAKGTLEIIAIDGDKVVGRLCHVKWSGFGNDFALDGKFIAPRCPE